VSFEKILKIYSADEDILLAPGALLIIFKACSRKKQKTKRC